LCVIQALVATGAVLTRGHGMSFKGHGPADLVIFGLSKLVGGCRSVILVQVRPRNHQTNKMTTYGFTTRSRFVQSVAQARSIMLSVEFGVRANLLG
jgi:hypothetical protein